MTIASLLCDAADASAIVAVAGGHRIELRQLRRDVAANAAALRMLGCRRGLLVARDAYSAAIGMLALFEAGAVVVMPPNLLPATLTSLAAEWDQLICDREIDGAAHSYVLAPGDDTELPLRRLDPEACRIELFTSGSSGNPKRVVKTLGQMEREASAIEDLLGRYLTASSTITGTVSHQHLYGLSFRVFWPLCSGRVLDSAVHEFWESLAGERLAGGAVITSPAHLTRIPGLAIASANRPALILSAGAPLPPAAVNEARMTFAAPIVEIYGSTETGVVAWRPRGDDGEPWRPLPGMVVRQTADDRILLTSPFLPPGTDHDGADRIRLLQDGTFHLLGRADRVAKIEGKRINLPDVEQRLREIASVAAASVVVLPGDKPCLAAAVVPTGEGATMLAEAGTFRFGRTLRKALAAVLEPAGLPRRWRFVTALPIGSLGKIHTEDVIALFGAQPAPIPEIRPQEPDLQARRQGPDWVELDLYNRPDLPQLDGHFPAIAVVPGVAQIDWAVKMAARFLGLPLASATSFQVKFHRLTLPETTVTLRLDYDRARQRLLFAYRKPDDQILTSGSIRVETP
jgi:acyl-coenzyme A synthetase/AMP-(fatty) acid ligase